MPIGSKLYVEEVDEDDEEEDGPPELMSSEDEEDLSVSAKCWCWCPGFCLGAALLMSALKTDTRIQYFPRVFKN